MREVKFRWIDQYLIHMTLKTKFTILAIIPIITLMGLSYILYGQFNSQIKQSHQQSALADAQKMVELIDLSLKYVPDDKAASFKQELVSAGFADTQSSLNAKTSRLVHAGGGTLMQGDSLTAHSRASSANLVAKTEEIGRAHV